MFYDSVHRECPSGTIGAKMGHRPGDLRVLCIGGPCRTAIAKVVADRGGPRALCVEDALARQQ